MLGCSWMLLAVVLGILASSRYSVHGGREVLESAASDPMH
jgi:hypothetical protein